jgi:hypothetical protein
MALRCPEIGATLVVRNASQPVVVISTRMTLARLLRRRPTAKTAAAGSPSASDLTGEALTAVQSFVAVVLVPEIAAFASLAAQGQGLAPLGGDR